MRDCWCSNSVSEGPWSEECGRMRIQERCFLRAVAGLCLIGGVVVVASTSPLDVEPSMQTTTGEFFPSLLLHFSTPIPRSLASRARKPWSFAIRSAFFSANHLETRAAIVCNLIERQGSFFLRLFEEDLYLYLASNVFERYDVFDDNCLIDRKIGKRVCKNR